MREEPCKVTGKGCRWWWCCDLLDDYGCLDMYCADCYRDKDWDLKDFGEEEDDDD